MATHLFRPRRVWLAFLAALAAALIAACSNEEQTLFIGGIPDQDASVLQERFNGLAAYLTEETGIQTRYIESPSYNAVVTAFQQGSIHLAWYGGLTGVQARLAVPGAQAIAQRSVDEHFESVFVAQKGSGITSLEDLRGKTFAFGSESSTSGNLMPRYFLQQAGIDPERDFAAVTFSGSHDTTWKLVEAGTVQAGALNANVWRDRVGEGEVDLARVDVFWTTPEYYDYHWVVRGDLDSTFEDGATEKVRQALLKLDANNGGDHQRIMEAFQAPSFIETNNDNYQAIETVARDLGIIE